VALNAGTRSPGRSKRKKPRAALTPSGPATSTASVQGLNRLRPTSATMMTYAAAKTPASTRLAPVRPRRIARVRRPPCRSCSRSRRLFARRIEPISRPTGTLTTAATGLRAPVDTK
jgi:hypothetical protein